MTTVPTTPPAPVANAQLVRQRALKLTIPASVAIIGCGGVGAWIAWFLALAGVKELWLFDPDTVSESNLNRLPVPASAIGHNKTDALKALIESNRPDCKVLAMGGWSPTLADTLNMGLTVPHMVCSTDTHAQRRATYEWAKTHNVRYYEAAAEGDYGSVTGAPAEWATDDEARPGYASVPVWVGPCVMAAAMSCTHILHNHKLGDRTYRMGWQLDALGASFDFFDSAKAAFSNLAVEPVLENEAHFEADAPLPRQRYTDSRDEDDEVSSVCRSCHEPLCEECGECHACAGYDEDEHD